jgi:hypothetical protein
MANVSSLLLATVLHLLSATLTLCSQDVTSGDQSTTVKPVKLTVSHVSSAITSITVQWNLTGGTESERAALQHFRVEATSLWSYVLLTSPQINGSEYTMPDLAIDAPYHVCVRSVDNGLLKDCDDMSTIPLVRSDSVIAILIAFLILALLIIIAIIWWRCAVYHARPKPEKEANGDQASDDKNEVIPDEKSPLLVPTNNSAPPNSSDGNKAPPAESPESVYLFIAGKAFE